MADSWVSSETNTHQDHVIAHVLGTTLLGYFVFDEAVYILLNIGFIWTILLDGQMGLAPHPVVISELEIDDESKRSIKADIELLLNDNQAHEDLLRMRPLSSELTAVSIFHQEERRRLLLNCDDNALAIETSLTTGKIHVYELDQPGS